MSYTLRQVKTGWEVQNGSSITVTVPKLSMVEEAVAMLTKQPAAKEAPVTEAPATKKKPAAKKKAAKESRREIIQGVLGGAKKPLTVREVIDRIGGVDADDEKFFSSIMSILAGKKILKRKKNADGVFEYSAKK